MKWSRGRETVKPMPEYMLFRIGLQRSTCFKYRIACRAVYLRLNFHFASRALTDFICDDREPDLSILHIGQGAHSA